jgi:hypothetical protein
LKLVPYWESEIVMIQNKYFYKSYHIVKNLKDERGSLISEEDNTISIVPCKVKRAGLKNEMKTTFAFENTTWRGSVFSTLKDWSLEEILRLKAELAPEKEFYVLPKLTPQTSKRSSRPCGKDAYMVKMPFEIFEGIFQRSSNKFDRELYSPSILIIPSKPTQTLLQVETVETNETKSEMTDKFLLKKLPQRVSVGIFNVVTQKEQYDNYLIPKETVERGQKKIIYRSRGFNDGSNEHTMHQKLEDELCFLTEFTNDLGGLTHSSHILGKKNLLSIHCDVVYNPNEGDNITVRLFLSDLHKKVVKCVSFEAPKPMYMVLEEYRRAHFLWKFFYFEITVPIVSDRYFKRIEDCKDYLISLLKTDEIQTIVCISLDEIMALLDINHVLYEKNITFMELDRNDLHRFSCSIHKDFWDTLCSPNYGYQLTKILLFLGCFKREGQALEKKELTYDLGLQPASSQKDEVIAQSVIQFILGTANHHGLTKYIAIDCEFWESVKLEEKAKRFPESLKDSDTKTFSPYPRKWSIINYFGTEILTRRTHNSGKETPTEYVNEFQKQNDLFNQRNCIIVGYQLEYDLQKLHLSPPKQNIRDASELFIYYDKDSKRFLKPKLKEVVFQLLGIKIQRTNDHHPTEDARAAMCLFRLYQDHWDPITGEIKTKVVIMSPQLYKEFYETGIKQIAELEKDIKLLKNLCKPNYQYGTRSEIYQNNLDKLTEKQKDLLFLRSQVIPSFYIRY